MDQCSKRSFGDHSANTHRLESLEPRVLLSGTVDIVAIGDSITQSDKNHNSFRRPLWQMLQNDNYDVNFVGSTRVHHRGNPPNSDFDRDHEGHWDWRADHVLNGRDGGKLSDWLNSYTPDIALIHLGTNDVIQNQSNSSTIDELDDIIDTLRADNPDVTILLSKLIPGRGRHATLPGRIADFNALIPGLANRKNTSRSPVIVVDQNSGFSIDGDTFDGIHPDESGEQKMAQKYFNALKPILDAMGAQQPPPPPPPPPNDPKGSISGNIYEDVAQNNQRDSGEPDLIGWTVYIDANDNGTFEGGETQTDSDSAGEYLFSDLDPNETYIIRAIAQPGFNPAEPGSGKYTVNLSPGENAGGRDFGFVQPQTGQDDHGNEKKTATKLGKLDKKTQLLTVGETVGGNDDPGDMFKFNLRKSGDVAITLSGLNNNADVRLYDRRGKKLLYQAAEQNGAGGESLAVNLKRGGYLVQVYKRPGDGSAVTPYNLQIEGDGASTLVTTASALEKEKIDGKIDENIVTRSGTLSATNLIDEYTFKTKGQRQINIDLSNITGQITAILTNGRGNKVLAQTFSTGGNVTLNAAGLKRGAHRLQIIQDSGGSAAYTLDLSATEIV